MVHNPTYIDVGMVYLIGFGLTAWLVVSTVLFARRIAAKGMMDAWRSVRYTLFGIALVLVVSGVVIGVLLGAAYGIGWLVALLGWWPFQN